MPNKLSWHLDIKKKKKKKKKDNDISWATTRYLYQRSKEEDVGRYDEQTHLQLRYVHAIAYMQTIRCRAPCACAAAMKDFPHVCVCVEKRASLSICLSRQDIRIRLRLCRRGMRST